MIKHCSIMFQNSVTVWRIDMGCLFAYVRICKTRQQPSSCSCCNIAVQSILLFHHSLITCSNMHEQRCWFIMMVPTTLFKSVRSSHEQSVPTCINKPVNRQKQAVRFYVCTQASKMRRGGWAICCGWNLLKNNIPIYVFLSLPLFEV